MNKKKWQDCWDRLTDPVLLKIFYHLSPKDILNAGETCTNWNRICYDDLLWRYLFIKNYNLSNQTELKPGINHHSFIHICSNNHKRKLTIFCKTVKDKHLGTKNISD